MAHVGPDPALAGGMSAAIAGLLASPLARDYRLEAIPTYRTAGVAQRFTVFVPALVALLRWCRGDGRRIVHVHAAVRGSLYRKSLCVAAAKLTGRPVVLQLHAGAGDIREFVERIGPVRRRVFGAILRRADRVLSVSGAGARELGHLLGVDGMAVVPNAAPRVPEPAGGRRAPGREDGAVDVLYMGGFADPAKGGAVLVGALPGIAAAAPRARFALAGPGEPPPALLTLCERQPAVRWLGWLDEGAKHERLADCDVFVLPSLSEGLPVALLEAMAHGRAIVASDMGGVPDVLTDGVDALLVAPGDAAALARAIESLARSPRRCVQLGAAAAAAAAELDDAAVAERLGDVYRQLLDAR